MVYIDLNMVRAGVVSHLEKWNESGFNEIQKPPKRYGIIDLQSLNELSSFEDVREFQGAHRYWVEQALQKGLLTRDDRWSESIAVRSLAFIDQVKSQLGLRAAHRGVLEADGTYALGEVS
jgi:putative transposase